MVYRALNADGVEVNIIEIMPEQIESYQALTGLTLELVVPTNESVERLDPALLESALNELGVETRE